MAENYDIFISYARRDGLEHAAWLENALTHQGYKVWRDTSRIDPTQDFTAQLEEAMENSECVIACITSDVRERKDGYVHRELGYAEALLKPIVVLRFADVAPPMRVINLDRFDFFTNRDASFEALRAFLSNSTFAQRGEIKPYDPFRPYVEALLTRIVEELKRTVLSNTITLAARTRSGAVLPVTFSGDQNPFGDGSQETDAHFEQFATAFAHYERRVLLLGDPGAGKTTTLLAFARDMAAARLADPSQPLPLLVRVASWTARGMPSFNEWLAYETPNLNAEQIESALQNGHALLMLDGLDELGGEREDRETKETFDPRVRFMGIIPQNNAIVVTSRIIDYEETGAKIALNGAVTLQALTDAQMQEYLSDLPELWEALSEDTDLRNIARNPLLLTLFSIGFAGLPAEARALRNLNRGEIRDRVFEVYVERRYAIERDKRALAFTLDEVRDILAKLAFRNVTNVYRATPGVVEKVDFAQALRGRNSDEMIELAECLQLLLPLGNDEYRFIHLLLRDHFAYPFAVNRLTDEDEFARPAAIAALGIIRDERAVPMLINVLTNANSGTKSTLFGSSGIGTSTAVALARIGEPAVQPLIDALENRGERIPFLVAEAIGRITDTRAIAHFGKILQTPYSNIRNAIIQTCGRIQDAQSIDILTTIARYDRDFDIRNNARKALQKVAPTLTSRDQTIEKAINRLQSLVTNQRFTEEIDNGVKNKILSSTDVDFLARKLFTSSSDLDRLIVSALLKCPPSEKRDITLLRADRFMRYM